MWAATMSSPTGCWVKSLGLPGRAGRRWTSGVVRATYRVTSGEFLVRSCGSPATPGAVPHNAAARSVVKLFHGVNDALLTMDLKLGCGKE
jgi:hypothetical protein